MRTYNKRGHAVCWASSTKHEHRYCALAYHHAGYHEFKYVHPDNLPSPFHVKLAHLKQADKEVSGR